MTQPIRPATTTPQAAADPREILRITADLYGPDLVVLTAEGDIDLSNAWMFERELARHDATPRLVVDMSGVAFCGVAGARALKAAASRSSVIGQNMAIVDNPAVARLLDAAGLRADIERLDGVAFVYEHAERNLREYAFRVAVAAGSGPESTVSELEPEPCVYIALSTPCPAYPGRDTVLAWDQRRGWAVGLESSSDEDLFVLGYLGPVALPSSSSVASFAAQVLSRRYAVRPGRPPKIDTTNLLTQLCKLPNGPE
jgi:anti-anti-sigma factor